MPRGSGQAGHDWRPPVSTDGSRGATGAAARAAQVRRTSVSMTDSSRWAGNGLAAHGGRDAVHIAGPSGCDGAQPGRLGPAARAVTVNGMREHMRATRDTHWQRSTWAFGESPPLKNAPARTPSPSALAGARRGSVRERRSGMVAYQRPHDRCRRPDGACRPAHSRHHWAAEAAAQVSGTRRARGDTSTCGGEGHEPHGGRRRSASPRPFGSDEAPRIAKPNPGGEPVD